MNLALHVVSETASTITLGWAPPVGCRGYIFVNQGLGKRSSTLDPTVKTVRFSKPGPYSVEALGTLSSGVWPEPVADRPAPPVLANDAITLKPRTGAARFSVPSNTDFILDMSAGPLEQYPGGACLHVNGGRNWKTYGPIVTHSPKLQGPGIGNDYGYSVYLLGQTGRGFIDGHTADGDGLAQGLALGCPYADLDVVDFDYRCSHPVWHTSNGSPAEVHSDGIQSWGGPRSLRLYNGRIVSAGMIIQVMPNQYGASPVGQWVTHDFYGEQYIHPSSDEGTWAVFKGGPKWAWDQKNFRVKALGTIGAGSWTNNEGIAAWTPGNSKGWPVTGEALQVIS